LTWACGLALLYSFKSEARANDESSTSRYTPREEGEENEGTGE